MDVLSFSAKVLSERYFKALEGTLLGRGPLKKLSQRLDIIGEIHFFSRRKSLLKGHEEVFPALILFLKRVIIVSHISSIWLRWIFLVWQISHSSLKLFFQ